LLHGTVTPYRVASHAPGNMKKARDLKVIKVANVSEHVLCYGVDRKKQKMQ